MKMQVNMAHLQYDLSITHIEFSCKFCDNIQQVVNKKWLVIKIETCLAIIKGYNGSFGQRNIKETTNFDMDYHVGTI